jgi:hypothetical protein
MTRRRRFHLKKQRLKIIWDRMKRYWRDFFIIKKIYQKIKKTHYQRLLMEILDRLFSSLEKFEFRKKG